MERRLIGQSWFLKSFLSAEGQPDGALFLSLEHRLETFRRKQEESTSDFGPQIRDNPKYELIVDLFLSFMAYKYKRIKKIMQDSLSFFIFW